MRKLFKQSKRTDSGASISFALLLFLVCAVVGSVVLTAGTAASGRVSRLVESDQRYYCVSSAASLLRDCIDGRSTTVTQTITTKVTKTVTYKDGHASSSKISEPDGSEYEVKAETSAGPFTKLLEQASQALQPQTPEDGEASPENSDTVLLFNDDLTLTFPENEKLSAAVTQTLMGDGTMILTVQNADGEHYNLSLIFTIERSQETRRKIVTGPATAVDSVAGYTISHEDLVTETTVTTFRWSLNELRKGEEGT